MQRRSAESAAGASAAGALARPAATSGAAAESLSLAASKGAGGGLGWQPAFGQEGFKQGPEQRCPRKRRAKQSNASKQRGTKCRQAGGRTSLHGAQGGGVMDQPASRLWLLRRRRRSCCGEVRLMGRRAGRWAREAWQSGHQRRQTWSRSGRHAGSTARRRRSSSSNQRLPLQAAVPCDAGR